LFPVKLNHFRGFAKPSGGLFYLARRLRPKKGPAANKPRRAANKPVSDIASSASTLGESEPNAGVFEAMVRWNKGGNCFYVARRLPS
jgi:hypothetical protein